MEGGAVMPRRFLTDLAQQWIGPPVTLHIIGATALALQMSLPRRTNDADVFEVAQLDKTTHSQLLALAGPNTVLATRHGMHVQIVGNGIPFLPRPPRWHLVPLLDAPALLDVAVLDVVDVVVSKLKRFHATDKSDIGAAAGAGLIPHEALVARFLTAVDGWIGDAREDQLPRYVRNLNEVERDILFVDETSVELPDWIDW